jgi:hypothetical protein
MLSFKEHNEKLNVQNVITTQIVKDFMTRYFGYNNIIDNILKKVLYTAYIITLNGFVRTILSKSLCSG